MKILKLLPLLAIVALILPSCGGDDDTPENVSTLSLPASTNFINSFDTQSGTLYELPGANIGIVVNQSQNIYQLTFNDLQYNSGKVATSFSLPELRYALTQTGWDMTNPGPIQVASTDGNHTVTDLNVKFSLRADGSQTLVGISLVLDSQYAVNVVLTQNAFVGTTTSTDITDPANAPFTTKNPQYMIELAKDKKTATLYIAYPQFLATMPTSIEMMEFAGIPVTMTRDGFSLNAASVIPSIKGTPYPNFEVTDVKANVISGKSLSLEFKCARFNRQVSVTGTPY